MSKSVKIVLLVLVGLGITVVGIYLFVLKSVDVDMEPHVSNQTIDFEELGEKVYIRAKSWGFTGDHTEILVSTSPINNPHLEYEKDKQFTFLSSPELYYQKKGVDSLFLYVYHKSEVPKNLTTQINIQQIELRNAKEIADYERNYKEYGLSKVSVYPSK